MKKDKTFSGGPRVPVQFGGPCDDPDVVVVPVLDLPDDSVLVNNLVKRQPQTGAFGRGNLL